MYKGDIMNKKFKKIVAGVVAGATLTTAGGMVIKKIDEKIKSKEDTYTVESGDTLYDISNKYYGTGIYFDDIADYNNISNPDDIKAGDVIKIPNIDVQKDEPIKGIPTYTIEKGDTLISICEKFYGEKSYEVALKLAEYNGIDDPDHILVGQTINIPVYEDLMGEQIKK